MATIPREIIKWIQSLNLTYTYMDKISSSEFKNQNELFKERIETLPFKDAKRDLFNGYYIAAIIKIYHPRLISLHSFENINSKKYKILNWNLLKKLFEHEKTIFSKITPDLYDKIIDNDFEQLVDFLIALYECFVNRVIKKNEFIKNIKEINNSLKNKDNTEAYLLTNNGLEKLDIKQDPIEEEETNKEDNNSKINNLDDSFKKNSHILKNDFNKNVSIRPLKKTSFIQKDLISNQINNANIENSMKNTFYDNQNEGYFDEKKEEEYKLINEKINTYIMEIIDSDSNFTHYLDILDFNSHMLYLIFAENINCFDELFISLFFEKIEENNKNSDFTNILIKDINELWKYVYFLLTALKHSFFENNLFFYFYDYLSKFIDTLKQKDINKIILFYNEFIIEFLCKLIKTCHYYEKRVYLIKLIYLFNENDEVSKHNCIRHFKEKINDNEIFIQSLHILLDIEEELNENNKNLIKEFKYYIKIGISHISKNIRLSTFALIRTIYNLKPEFIENFLIINEKKLNIYDWWELKAVIITIISKILSRNFNSEYYKNLKRNSNQILKNINEENSKFNIKEIINYYVNLTIKLMKSSPNENIKKIFLIYFVPIINESNKLLELYINVLIEINDDLREWILFNAIPDQNDIEEKCLIEAPYTLFYKISWDNEFLKNIWCEILIEIVNIIKDKKEFNYKYLLIIQFCFENANFSDINVEHFDYIGNNLFDYFLIGLKEESLKENCFKFLKVFIIYSIKGEIIIKEFEKKLLQYFINIFNDKNENNIIEENITYLKEISDSFTKENPFYEKYLEFNEFISKGLESNLDNKELVNRLFN